MLFNVKRIVEGVEESEAWDLLAMPREGKVCIHREVRCGVRLTYLRVTIPPGYRVCWLYSTNQAKLVKVSPAFQTPESGSTAFSQLLRFLLVILPLCTTELNCL